MLISSVAEAMLKRLLPETIKACTTNRTVGASMWRSQDTLSQCSTSDVRVNLEPFIFDLRGDEVEMKL
jgi:hypothetical protein